MDNLMIKSSEKEYHGAFHDLDLSLTRGAGHYMKNPNDFTGIPENVRVCKFHLNELVTNWNGITNKHILYGRGNGLLHFRCE